MNLIWSQLAKVGCMVALVVTSLALTLFLLFLGGQIWKLVG